MHKAMPHLVMLPEVQLHRHIRYAPQTSDPKGCRSAGKCPCHKSTAVFLRQTLSARRSSCRPSRPEIPARPDRAALWAC